MNCCWMLLLVAALVTVAHASPHELETLSRVARTADCGCDYHKGGCVIFEPAPRHYKCVCVYRLFWSCAGWATPCSATEHCVGGDASEEACRLGGGDCGGYPRGDDGTFPGDF